MSEAAQGRAAATIAWQWQRNSPSNCPPLPFAPAPAADGTNVVKIFEEAVSLAHSYKTGGEKDFVAEVLELLDESALGAFGRALYGPGSPPSGGASAPAAKTASRTAAGAGGGGGGSSDAFEVGGGP
jgi:hypothetical protein